MACVSVGALRQLLHTLIGPPMTTETPFAKNKVILCHFDSYSTALVFARWPDRSLLLPGPLPADAHSMAALEQADPAYGADLVKQAAIAQYGLNPDELVYVDDFNQWIQTVDGPVRIHLLRFTTFEAPAHTLAPHEATFKPISELRGSAPVELGLVREVFNLIMGGGGR